MARAQVEQAPVHGLRTEFDRFRRDSPFEFDRTAEPVPQTRYVGLTVVASETTIVRTGVHDTTSRISGERMSRDECPRSWIEHNREC